MREYSPNVAFLTISYEPLAKVASLAERYFADDPNTCLMKLRQFAELLANYVAAQAGVDACLFASQFDLLKALEAQAILPAEINQDFHQIRSSGNRAVHSLDDQHAEALSMLKIARQLAIWFYRTFHDPKFNAGPFTPPKNPQAASQALQAELEQLRQELEQSRSEEERARVQFQAAADTALSAEERVRREQQERAQWEQLAAEFEQDKTQLEAELQALQAATHKQQSTGQLAQIIERSRIAAQQVQLDESTTRTLIDQQLREAGWEADSAVLRYRQGTRPEAKRMLAIAEWPAQGGSVV